LETTNKFDPFPGDLHRYCPSVVHSLEGVRHGPRRQASVEALLRRSRLRHSRHCQKGSRT
uniref:DNA-directed RNA polymerase n=1 Tax=Haemonchus placei TaxID=6290 RepID=A0A0N4X7M5_HAEPC